MAKTHPLIKAQRKCFYFYQPFLNPVFLLLLYQIISCCLFFPYELVACIKVHHIPVTASVKCKHLKGKVSIWFIFVSLKSLLKKILLEGMCVITKIARVTYISQLKSSVEKFQLPLINNWLILRHTCLAKLLPGTQGKSTLNVSVEQS